MRDMRDLFTLERIYYPVWNAKEKVDGEKLLTLKLEAHGMNVDGVKEQGI